MEVSAFNQIFSALFTNECIKKQKVNTCASESNISYPSRERLTLFDNVPVMMSEMKEGLDHLATAFSEFINSENGRKILAGAVMLIIGCAVLGVSIFLLADATSAVPVLDEFAPFILEAGEALCELAGLGAGAAAAGAYKMYNKDIGILHA